MFKIPQIFILTGLLLVTSALQCYAADGYKQGAVEVEAGASIGSKVVGTSDKILTKKVQADGDKGYKYGISYGINDKFILQYKGGTFITERAQVPQKVGAITFILSGVARAEADEFNLLYKVNDNVSAVVGYLDSSIAYNDVNFTLPGKIASVPTEDVKSFQAGLVYHKPINDKYTFYTSAIFGKDIHTINTGVTYKITEDTSFSIGYAERVYHNVNLKIALDGVVADNKYPVKYKMSGISCMFTHKLI